MKKLISLAVIMSLGLLVLSFMNKGAILSLGGSGNLDKSAIKVSELNSTGIRFLESRQFDDALTNFREANRLDPENEIVSRNLSLAISRKAQSQMDSGNDKGYVENLEESIKNWHMNPEALELLSVEYYQHGKYEESLEVSVRLFSVYPKRQDLPQFIARVEDMIREEKGMVSETGHFFRLLYSGNRKLEFEGELLGILQHEVDSLASSLGVFPKQVIDVMVLTDDLGARATPDDPFINGLYDGKIRLYLNDVMQDQDQFIKTVRHEMVHALLHRGAGNLPAWLHEGLAQKIGEDPPPSEINKIRAYVGRLLESGVSINFSDMQDTFISLPEKERANSYAASLVFIDHLITTYGEGLVPILVSDMSDGMSIDGSLTRQTDRNLNTLKQEFFMSLKREGA